MVVVAAEKVLLMRIAKASDDDIAAERVHDEIAARMHVHRAARDVAAKPNGVLELHARDSTAHDSQRQEGDRVKRLLILAASRIITLGHAGLGVAEGRGPPVVSRACELALTLVDCTYGCTKCHGPCLSLSSSSSWLAC